MKGRVVAVDKSSPDGIRAALMIDGQLADFALLPHEHENIPMPGEIRRARVRRVLPNGRGAFCELGSAGEGFLRQPGQLKTGEETAVQIASIPEPGKAVPVNSRLLFKGPRLILTPQAPGVNVSRRIGNDLERDRLAQAIRDSLNTYTSNSQDIGVIVRSAAKGEGEDELQVELGRLFSEHETVVSSLKNKAPGGELLAQSALSRLWAEWLFPLPEQILYDRNTAEINKALKLRESNNSLGSKFLPWGGERAEARLRPSSDPLHECGAYDALRSLNVLEFPLSGGGSMVIESTRAFVAIDINTGSDFSQAAGLKVNLAAATQVFSQLRVRGLGGQIIIDFAPMPKKDRRTLEEALKKGVRNDPIETSLIGWTTMGLFEVQRKRERRPLPDRWVP